jgi:hypothetical protein
MVLNATFNNMSFISLRKWSTNNFLREAWYEKDTTERKVSFLFYLYLDKVSANFIFSFPQLFDCRIPWMI